MAEEQESVNDFAEKVKEQLSSYADVKIELLKAQWVEKTALIVSKMVTSLIVLFVLFFTIMFASMVAGYYFGELLGSTMKGFGIIALFYTVLLVVIIVFRKSLIQHPVSNIIISTIYQDDDEE